ncbi:MAG: hypothetical protein ACI9S8_002031 [Chlamydiales bacterium]|jgi:hypothetical protein
MLSTEKVPQSDIYNCFWDAVKSNKTASAKHFIDMGDLSSRCIQKAFVRSLELNNRELALHILKKHEIDGHRLEEGITLAITKEFESVFEALMKKSQISEQVMEMTSSLARAQQNQTMLKILGYED